MAGAGAVASAVAEALSDSSTLESVLDAARCGAMIAEKQGYPKGESRLLSLPPDVPRATTLKFADVCLRADLEAGLTGYTYLDDSPLD